MVFPNFKFSTYITILVGFVLVLSISLTVIVLQQQQEARSRAATEGGGVKPNPRLGDQCIAPAGKGTCQNSCTNPSYYSYEEKAYCGNSLTGPYLPLTCCVPSQCFLNKGQCVSSGKSCGSLGKTQATYKCPTANPKCCVTKTSTPPANPPPANPPPPVTTTSTKLAIPLAFLHIIGKAGDSVLPGEAGGGNMDPDHDTREVTINITDESNNPKVTDETATLTFDSASGSFKTTTPIDLGNLPTASYKITLKMPMSLPLTVTQTLTSGATTPLQTVSLVTGDTNNDGKLDILDWNMLLDCFSDIEDAKACSDESKKLKSDITDDGEVAHPDLNVFVRECKENC